ncbi:MAG: chemotaxis protein CheW [Snowella sp.]|nr:chemotaxis protein CheW [Snowella sp.]
MTYYLNFTHNNLRYGVPATAVQEVFFLPEITPIPEAPADILGTVNVRGTLIPVMDLNLRFGYPVTPYSLNDSIIILNWQELTLGILTNQVHEVRSIDDQLITPELSHDHPLLDFKQEKFINGYLQEDENLLLLLNLEALLRYTEAQDLNLELDLDVLEILESGEEPTEESLTDEETPEIVKSPLFFPEASPYERKVLQKRADNLRQSLKLKDLTGLKPLAVFNLNQEFFGVDLSLIQEFIKFSRVTLIPCAPSFIVGNINLRGEIVTLIDIRSLFNLPRAIASKNPQAMIVNVDGVVVGLLIDAIYDILMLNPKDVLAPSTVESELNQNYLQGVLPYKDKMLGLINLTEIILGGSLLVDEAV